MNYGLNEEQLNYYRTFGYIVVRQLFTAADIQTIAKEFEQAMAEQYPHKPFDGTQHHWTVMLDEGTPFFASLLEDPRFLTIVQQMYGENILGVATDANRYVGNTIWHPDTVSPLQYGVKFAFYLQPVRANTGALRVIPASHWLFPFKKEYCDGVRQLPIQDVPCQVLDSEPGDIVAFDLRLWHGSYGGNNDRRMCTVVYYNDPQTPDEVEFLRKQGEANVGYGPKRFDPKRKFLYSRTWLANPNGSPHRQRWINRLREVGYFDAPGVVETQREQETLA